MAAVRTFDACDLKPGDEITFDFTGSRNRLGDVVVFDAYPIGRLNHHLVPMVQLVLIHPTQGYCHRQVAATTRFVVR